MNTFFNLLIPAHVLAGVLAIGGFWLTVAFRKGRGSHARAGRAYRIIIVALGATGVLMSLAVLADPLAVRFAGSVPANLDLTGFNARQREFAALLLMLSLLVLADVEQGVRVLRARHDMSTLRRGVPVKLQLALGVASVGVVVAGLSGGHYWYLPFAGLGFFTCRDLWRYARSVDLPERVWLREHLSSMLGSGIAIHTAFLVFGGRTFLLDVTGGGWITWAAWLLPTVVGIAGIRWAKRYYSPRLGFPVRTSAAGG